jgi:hypothetical protein
MALGAMADLLCTLPGAELLSPMVACLAAATLGSVALAFTAVTLVSERTERQLRDSRRRLRVLANLDPLTQVPNRRRFQELADDALRHDTPGSAVLVMFDLDHFKQSTTAWATPPAIARCAWSAAACWSTCAPRMCPGATAATSSCCCCARPTRVTP